MMVQISGISAKRFEEAARRSCRLDGVSYSKNAALLEVALGTWSFLFPNTRQFLAMLRLVQDQGLRHVIEGCSTAADELIAYIDQHNCTFNEVDLSALSLVSHKYIVLCKGTQLNKWGLSMTIDTLRFLKRFSYIGDTSIAGKGLQKFLNTNDKHLHRAKKDEQDHFLRTIVWPYMRYHLDKMFDGFSARPDDGRFTNGTCYDTDGSKTILSKMVAYQAKSNFMDGYQIDPYMNYTERDTTKCSVINGMPETFCRASSVPKNYKTTRIVCPEEAFRNYHATPILDALYQCIDRNKLPITYDTQEKSRVQCKLAALKGDYVTVDLHSASDSISWSEAYAVTPRPVFDAINNTRATRIAYKKGNKQGKLALSWIWLTSGHPCTWAYESFFFLAVCYTAADIAYNLGIAESRNYDSFVYGDDLIIPYEIYDILLAIFDAMNIGVNMEKTFTGNYRESCGVEYYLSEYLSSKYWPRKEIVLPSRDEVKGKNLHNLCRQDETYATSIGSLIQLQHSLYDYEGASNYLEEVVCFYIPDMTFSDPGTECEDLWGFNTGRIQYPKGIDPKTASSDLLHAAGRTRHYALKTLPVKGNLPFKSDSSLHYADLYRYLQWLKFGSQPLDAPVYYWINGVRYERCVADPGYTREGDAFGTRVEWRTLLR